MTESTNTLNSYIVKISELQRQLEEAKVEAHEAALEQARYYVKNFGITADELFSTTSKVKKNSRNQAKPKYVTPDGTRTWSGRGFMPKVFKELIKAGIPMESMRIDK